jgi:acyl dehydratase
MKDPKSLVRAQIGQIRHSQWILIDQPMINIFADATRDHQFIHVNPERAAKTPFGGTIAHGFLILSLLSFMQESVTGPVLKDIKMGVNYGFDRVRFISPVRSGSNIRAVSTLVDVQDKDASTLQLTHDILVEIEGADKPAMKAAWITRLLF